MLNLRYARTGRAKNGKKVKGMPFPMYDVFILYLLDRPGHQVLCISRAVNKSRDDCMYKTAKLFAFFTDQLNVDVL